MNTRLTHLTFIQNIIRGYDHQSLLLKGGALAVVLVLFVVQMLASGKTAGIAVIHLTGFILVLSLWLADARLHQQKGAYGALYDRVRMEPGAESDLSLHVDGLIEPAGLRRAAWATPVAYLYVGSLVGLAVLALATPFAS
ncbi:hypothetical protein [Azospirillum sp. sgz302134]